jgi:hypothetical protein
MEVCEDLKAIYTAPTADAEMLNLEAFADEWDKKYEYISRSWLENWEFLSSFWSHPTEIRKLIYTTNPMLYIFLVLILLFLLPLFLLVPGICILYKIPSGTEVFALRRWCLTLPGSYINWVIELLQ